MIRLLPLLLLAATFTPEAEAQEPLPVPGQVTLAGDLIRVEMQLTLDVPLGATLYTLRRVVAGDREVGVVSGVYRVVEAEGLLVRAQPAVGYASGASVSDGVEVADDGTSTLLIDSVPVGAAISWNGRRIGVTPDTLSLAPGAYTFHLDLSGYDTSVYTVDMQGGTSLEESITMDEAQAALRYFRGGDAHFFRNEYDEAVEKLTQAVGVSDGSMSQDQITLALYMLRAAGRMQEVSTRARQAGTPEAQVKEAAYALKNIYRACEQRDVASVEAQTAILKAALPTDPFIISFQACAQ